MVSRARPAIDQTGRLGSSDLALRPTPTTEIPMPVASNTKQIAHIDCPGGGQVWVDGTIMYVGHMRNPSGTSIYDIADPKNPKQIARVDIPDGWHSHKVRAQNGIMIVNHEKLGAGG